MSERAAYTVRDFCFEYSVGRTKANELMASGAIKRIKLGRRTLISAESVRRWFASLELAHSFVPTQIADSSEQKRTTTTKRKKIYRITARV